MPGQNSEILTGTESTLTNFVKALDTKAVRGQTRSVPRGACAAFSLRLYRKVLANPKADDTSLAKYGELVASEMETDVLSAERKAGPPTHSFPRMGVEVEDFLLTSTLRQLGAISKAAKGTVEQGDLLRAGKENPIAGREDIDPSGLKEIAIHPSASAEVQADALAQLQAMGVFDDRGDKPSIPIGLHANFELPKGVTKQVIEDPSNNFVYDMALVTNLITMAYTSPERILSRKTPASFTYDKAAIWGSRTDTSGHAQRRFELRSLELDLKDPNLTKEMLTTAQKVVAAMTSYMKRQTGAQVADHYKQRTGLDMPVSMIEQAGLKMSDMDIQLAKVWERVRGESMDANSQIHYLLKTLGRNDDPDFLFHNKEQVADNLGDGTLAHLARHDVLARLSAEIGNIEQQFI